MKTLEACYEINFNKFNFLERKIAIKDAYTILLGPPKSGKSYLIYDYLSNEKEESYLYIDFDNFKNTNITFNEIEDFIKEKNIEILVLENFDFSFEIPFCNSVVISTSTPKKIDGFETLIVMPLDFEEYLLHDHKHQNITSSFNQFLKYGNLCEIINIEDFSKEQRLQDIIKLYAKNETELYILRLLFSQIDEKKSVFQLFTIMKKEHKISKDKFYETCKKFQDNFLVFFISKYESLKAVKKLYAYNHAYLPSITHNKKFKNEFSNMIFLELFSKKEEIYYLDNIDF